MTEKGSVYTVNNKSTQRIKKKRMAHGNDFGLKEMSDITIYISEEAGRAVASHVSLAREFAPTFILTEDYLFLVFKKNNKWEFVEVKINYSLTPDMNLTPVEFWGLEKNKVGHSPTKYHVGNKIIKIA
jgi:hypothetical protein